MQASTEPLFKEVVQEMLDKEAEAEAKRAKRKVSKSSSEPNTPDTPSTSSDVPNISLLTESCVSPDEKIRYSTPDFRLFSVVSHL